MTRSPADLRLDLLAIVRAGIAAAGADALVDRTLAISGSTAIYLVAAGKAAPAMAMAASRRLGGRIRAGLVVSQEPGPVPEHCESVVGGHPVPTDASVRGGRRALELAESVARGETLLVLLSGGASALMAAPAPGLTLEDKRATTNRLLRAGADIHALNTVRKHLSAVKGGRLAARTQGACHALVISDVVDDDLSVIASGPTVGDASRFQDALDVLRRFDGEDVYPPTVVGYLRRGASGEEEDTPNPGDPRLARATTTVIGSRRDAMAGALTEGASRGYHLLRLDDAVVGESRTTALAHLHAVLARAHGVGRPACIVSSGETTVRVVGRGTGGRNQEFALAAADTLSRLGAPGAVASVGTDGIDGPTDAAGALADSTTVERARAAGLTPGSFLADNNAYAFFAQLGDLIHTGPTGTNVGDLQVVLLS